MATKFSLANASTDLQQADSIASRSESSYDNLSSLLLSPGMTYKQRLKELLRRKSVLRGTFTLASGKVSNYYIDCKLTTLDPEGAFLVGQTVLDLLDEEGIDADAIGGPPIGAHPIVAAVAAVSFIRNKAEGKGKLLPAFLIREAHKSHGLHKQIEGIEIDQAKKTRVVIIDEVCTTGKSTEDALVIVERAGFHVVAVLSLVDREEGGSDKLRSKYLYRSIFTTKDLLSTLSEDTEGSQDLSAKPIGRMAK